jgi:hypothetical protein
MMYWLPKQAYIVVIGCRLWRELIESFLTPNEVSKKLQEWLIEEEDYWGHNKINDPAVLFNLQITSKQPFRSIHAIVDGIHDRILFVAMLNLTEEQKKAFSLQPPLDKRRLGSSLLMLLYQLGIAASTSYNIEDKIEHITLQKFIYFDGLSKDRFFDSVFTMVMGIESVHSFFNTLPPVSNDSESLK